MIFFFVVCSDHKTADSFPHSQEVRSETSSNPSSPEICPNKERSEVHLLSYLVSLYGLGSVHVFSVPLNTDLFLLSGCGGLCRPFVKLKECSSRSNISRSSSSTSSFSSTAGEGDGLEELDTVSH